MFKYKKIYAILLIVAMMNFANMRVSFSEDTTNGSEQEVNQKLHDIEGHQYEESIKKLVEANILSGDEQSMFHPDKELTRAEACIMIVKTIDPKTYEIYGTATEKLDKSKFQDLIGFAWADDYIAYAVKKGIVKGYEDGTFKPKRNVTFNEMVTMTLRALNISQEDIGEKYPEDYISKAEQIQMMKNIKKEYPILATKAVAAELISTQMDEIRKNNNEKISDKASEEKSEIGDSSDMKFAEGIVDTRMMEFDGKKISENVQVYSTTNIKEYSEKNEMPKEKSEYRKQSIYRYKDTETKCLYIEKNGEITKMIFQSDTGYTGCVYGFISSLSQEKYCYTQVANRNIQWDIKKETVNKIQLDKKSTLCKMSVTNGKIEKIEYPERKISFGEMTKNQEWNAVKEMRSNYCILENDEKIQYSDNITYYKWDEDKRAFIDVRISEIAKASKVRAYDISDDGERRADVVCIR